MKTAILIVFLFFAPGLALAVSEQETETLAKDLSQAIDTYKNLDRGLSTYDVVLRRDPLQPLVDEQGNIINPAALHTGLSVQGIIRSKDFKSILVDGEFYSEGDQVGPYRVLEIQENGFWAGEDEEKIFVPLYSDNSVPANAEPVVPSQPEGGVVPAH